MIWSKTIVIICFSYGHVFSSLQFGLFKTKYRHFLMLQKTTGFQELIASVMTPRVLHCLYSQNGENYLAIVTVTPEQWSVPDYQKLCVKPPLVTCYFCYNSPTVSKKIWFEDTHIVRSWSIFVQKRPYSLEEEGTVATSHGYHCHIFLTIYWHS